MKRIKTEIYQIHITKVIKELTIPKSKLENEIEKINYLVKHEKDTRNSVNLDGLRRIFKTGQMLLDGYKIEDISLNLEIKRSTIEGYVFYLI